MKIYRSDLFSSLLVAQAHFEYANLSTYRVFQNYHKILTKSYISLADSFNTITKHRIKRNPSSLYFNPFLDLSRSF